MKKYDWFSSVFPQNNAVLRFEKIADCQFEKSKTKMADKLAASSCSSCKSKYKYKRNTCVDDVTDFVLDEGNSDCSFNSELDGESSVEESGDDFVQLDTTFDNQCFKDGV